MIERPGAPTPTHPPKGREQDPPTLGVPIGHPQRGCPEQSAQPDVRRRPVLRSMPELVEAHARELDRRRPDRQRKAPGVVVREMPARRHDQIGARQQVGREAEVRALHPAVAAHAQGGEARLHHAALGDRIGHRHDVRGPQVALGAELALGGPRMVLGHEADDVVLQQRGAVQVLGRLGPVADHDVDRAVLQGQLVVVLRAERLRDQARIRRLRAEAAHHLREEGRRQVVGHRDGEAALRRRRIEALAGVQQAVEQAQRGLRLRGRGERARRRHHGVLVAHQQRVVEDLAQPLERRADGGLRLVHPDRGARNALLGDQRAQHAQQIGLEGIVGAGHVREDSGYRLCYAPYCACPVSHRAPTRDHWRHPRSTGPRSTHERQRNRT